MNLYLPSGFHRLFCYTVYAFVCVRKCDICGGREIGVCARVAAVLGFGLLLIVREIASRTVQRVLYFWGTFVQLLGGRIRKSVMSATVCLSVRPSVCAGASPLLIKHYFGGGGVWVRELDSISLTKTKNRSGRNEVTETSGRLHPSWPQNK